MSARSLSPRITSTAALGISVLLAVMALWYYRLYVGSPIAAGYGFYIGVVATIARGWGLSVFAMVVAWAESSRGQR